MSAGVNAQIIAFTERITKFHQYISNQISKQQDAPPANPAASSSSSDDEFLPAKVSVAAFQIPATPPVPTVDPRTSPAPPPKAKPSKRSPLFNVVDSSSRASGASSRRSRADSATELQQRSFASLESSDSDLPAYEAPVPDRFSGDAFESGRQSGRSDPRKTSGRRRPPLVVDDDDSD
jgi:hypothetical protein